MHTSLSPPPPFSSSEKNLTRRLNPDLLGISDELDEVMYELAYLGNHYKNFHPANAGDVSVVLDHFTAAQVLRRYDKTATPWVRVAELERLQAFRNDGRTGYRSQGVDSVAFNEWMQHLKGRLVLITRTGAQIPALVEYIRRGQDGKLLTIIEVNSTATGVRIVFGSSQYGSIPSIETHVHLLSSAITIASGKESAATVHAHPSNLILLGRHGRIRGDYHRFNAAAYTQVEGLLRNCPELVGVVPFAESGSADLVLRTMASLIHHRATLWMNHGFIVRETNVRQAYTLMDYAEDAARAALDGFRTQAQGLPPATIATFLSTNRLDDAYGSLKTSSL